MSLKKLMVPCLLLTVLSPLAEAKHRNRIPKSAKSSQVTGAKHFKYKPGKKQKLKKHNG